MKRPAVGFLAWSSAPGRSSEIAAALDGQARCYYDLGIARSALVPVRYAVSAVRTLLYLVVHRPRALIVTNPPIVPTLVAYPYARLARVPLLLDSHPDAFRSDSVHSRFLRIHAWLARRARAILVTTDDLVRLVESWGGTGIIVHEPPPAWVVDSSAPLYARPRILVLGSLSVDEPLAEVIEAARLLPEVDFELTGDTRRCPLALVTSAPDNVAFLGYLDARDYRAALERTSVVVVLTTWLQWAVPRSAYDAVYARRPLVLTGSSVLTELFPYAIPVENSGESIAGGVREAIDRHAELVGSAGDALRLQSSRWEAQLDSLRSLIAPS